MHTRKTQVGVLPMHEGKFPVRHLPILSISYNHSTVQLGLCKKQLSQSKFLVTQIQAINQCPIALDIFTFQIIKQTATLVDHAN